MSILLVTFFYLDYAFPVYRKLVGIESYWSGHYPHEVLLHLLVLKGSNIVVERPSPSWSCYCVSISTNCDKKVLSLSLFGLTNQVKARVLFCIGSYSAKGTFICNSHYYNNPFWHAILASDLSLAFIHHQSHKSVNSLFHGCSVLNWCKNVCGQRFFLSFLMLRRVLDCDSSKVALLSCTMNQNPLARFYWC